MHIGVVEHPIFMVSLKWDIFSTEVTFHWDSPEYLLSICTESEDTQEITCFSEFYPGSIGLTIQIKDVSIATIRQRWENL